MPRSEYEIIIPNEKDGHSLLKLIAGIENFKLEDIACIEGLWREFLHGGNEPDRYHFLIAKAGYKLLGFACYGHRPLTTGTYDFYWLAVAPNFRESGIGHALMKSVENGIRALGGYLAVIETSGLISFSSTRAFYLSCGYQLVVQIPDFYHPGDDLVIFTKRLMIRSGNG